jgi:hypothetical protein
MNHIGTVDNMTTDVRPQPPRAATVAMWMGLTSLICWPAAIVAGPLAIILGHVGLSEIRRLHLPGRDRAIFALAIGYGVLVCGLAILIFALPR